MQALSAADDYTVEVVAAYHDSEIQLYCPASASWFQVVVEHWFDDVFHLLIEGSRIVLRQASAKSGSGNRDSCRFK